MDNTKVYGHRGCMGIFPENTLISIEKAIEQGVDGIEIDVHMTKDGEIVVIHDEKLDRTTDGTGYIKDLNLAEIKEYSAGVKFSQFPHYDESVWKFERVPTLKEVLELIAPYDIELNIEFKTSLVNYEGIEEKVLNLVNQYGDIRNIIYSSFHLPTLIRIKKLEPSCKIALIYEHQIPHPNDYIKTFDMEGLHMAKHIAFLEENNLKVINGSTRVWTVNDEDEMKQLLDLGVDTIVSDFPEKVLHIRNARKA